MLNVTSLDGTASQKITVTVTGTNDAPLVTSDFAVGGEDTLIVIDVLFNDSDPNGLPLSIDPASITALHGSASVVGNKIHFIPDADFSGQAEITYRATNGSVLSDVATVKVDVAPVADQPVLTLARMPVIFDGATVQVAYLFPTTATTLGPAQPSNPGNITAGSGIDWTYTNYFTLDFDGNEIILNFAANQFSGSGSASFSSAAFNGLRIQDIGANDLASIENVSIISSNMPGLDASRISWTSDGILINFQSLTYAKSTVVRLGVTGEANAYGLEDTQISLPQIGAALQDTDGSESLETLELSSLPVGSVVSDGTHSVTVGADGKASILGWDLSNLALLPPENFNGKIVVSVNASSVDVADLSGGESVDRASTEKSFALIVRAVDDPVVITGPSSAALQEDIGPQSASGQLTAMDPDFGATSFATPTASALSGAYGSFTFDPGTGAWTYTLDDRAQALTDGQMVEEVLTVTSLDGTASQAITVTVTGTNDGPALAAVDDTASVNEDTPILIDVLANDTGTAIEIVSQSLSATNGVATLEAGKIRFVPTANFHGEAVIRYQVTDGAAVSEFAEVTVTVNSLNDVPQVSQALPTRTTGAGGNLVFTLPADAFSDADGDVLTFAATTSSGGSLPSWISFDADTRTFTAPRPCPIQVWCRSV